MRYTTEIDSENVAEVAAQWGSYMNTGDPGACMYGFNLTGRVQNEWHRRQCLTWIAQCKTHATRAGKRELDALAAYIKAAPRDRA